MTVYPCPIYLWVSLCVCLRVNWLCVCEGVLVIGVWLGLDCLAMPYVAKLLLFFKIHTCIFLLMYFLGILKLLEAEVSIYWQVPQ